MNNAFEILGNFVCLLGLVAALILIRWFFRINEMAGYLQRLADKLAPLNTELFPKRPPDISVVPQADCDCCHKYFSRNDLTELAIGKTVCPVCLKKLKV